MLSIIISGINTENWINCWNSINEATTKPFEILFVGPNYPPQELFDKGNVVFINDFGSPTRCMQRGLVEAKYDWMMFAWDNGKFTPHVIDEAFEEIGMDKNVAVSFKYVEGNQPISFEYMGSDIYYQINHHNDAQSEYIPDNYILMNVGIVSKEKITKIGGLDCHFEAPSMALVDLAIRLQKYGVNIKLHKPIAYLEDWNPGSKGSHGPIHFAMVEHDIPLYKLIWLNETCQDRLIIPLDNWKKSPDKWKRRFK